MKFPTITLKNMSKFRGAKPKPAAFGTTPSESMPDPDRLPPVFSFEHMRSGSGYSVDCCQQEHRAAVAARLFKLSQMTWLQIRQAPRHGLGTEKIDRTSIRPPLPLSLTDDVNLLAIRYNGIHPMVGYRDGRIFHILFIDHTMDVYPHR
jgi:hypothetical protein